MTEEEDGSFSFRVTIEDAQERVKKNPDSHMNQGLLGELLYQAKRYAEAIEPLQKGAKLLQKEVENSSTKPYPGYVGPLSNEMATKILHSFHMMRGDSLLRLERYSEARKAIESASTVISEDADTWNLLGIVQANSGEIEEALKSFRDAVRHNPARSDIWENLQNSYRHLKRVEANEIIPAIKGKRDIEQDLALLSELYLSGGEYEKVMLVLNQLFEWNKDDTRALIPLARLRLFESSTKEAIQILEKTVKLDQKNEVAMWELGRAYCLLGDKKKSEKTLDNLLKRNAEHRNAHVLKNLMALYGAATKQTFGVLTVKDRSTDDEDGNQLQMTEYFMYPVLTLPMGSTIEDVVHALVRGEVSRFTSEEYLKGVSTYSSRSERGISFQVNGVPTKAWEFKYLEPGSMRSSHMETGRGRGINLSGDKSELIVNGDVILLGSEMSMIERTQIGLMYSIIKRQAEEKIANWPFKY